MIDNNDNLFTSPTGEHGHEPSVKRIVIFDKYEIEIELSASGQFLNIVSVKYNKDFMDSIKSSINPTVHDVEKYYSEE